MEHAFGKITGTAWVFGDNIDTDQIYPGKYLALLDPVEMGHHAMEGVPENKAFQSQCAKGDILVVGQNFGCGSSREHAPLALTYRGVSVIIGVSFAHIFHRNAVNIGMPILESNDAKLVNQGDRIQIDLDTGEGVNLTTNARLRVSPITGLERDIILSGGLIPYIKKTMSDQRTPP